MNNTYIKDPDAVLPYGFDWSAWLDSDDRISTSTWEIQSGSGLTSVSTAIENGVKTLIKLSGGTESGATDLPYKVTNTIVTSNGLTDVRSLYIRVQAR